MSQTSRTFKLRHVLPWLAVDFTASVRHNWIPIRWCPSSVSVDADEADIKQCDGRFYECAPQMNDSGVNVFYFIRHFCLPFLFFWWLLNQTDS